MEKSQVTNLMLFVKGIWQEQSTDDPTINAWIEVFYETSLTLPAIKQAVLSRARAGLERPTPGQIHHEASIIEQEETERARYSRKALLEPQPAPEERERMQKLLQDLVDKLSMKILMAPTGE
jgi:hypothetical protein